MPIKIPSLDDRKYQELLDEALARIPVHNPEWTNFNKSDPGVTLVEDDLLRRESSSMQDAVDGGQVPPAQPLEDGDRLQDVNDAALPRLALEDVPPLHIRHRGSLELARQSRRRKRPPGKAVLAVVDGTPVTGPMIAWNAAFSPSP